MRNIKKKKTPRETVKEHTNLSISQFLNLPLLNYFEDLTTINSIVLKFCKQNKFSYESGYSSKNNCFTAKIFLPSELNIYEFKDFHKESAALAMALTFTLNEMTMNQKEIIWKQ